MTDIFCTERTFGELPREAVRSLLIWFARAKRDLPWRREVTPYRVWVSEIMLQQTRVEAVIPYFERFVAELQDIAALANVPEERLMKLWEGLGYYSRARNLQRAAQAVLRDFDGQLPASVEKLRTLPGIGPYTAGAIASIAFGIPAAAVDGNVLRVLTRMTGCNADIRKPETVRAAEKCVLAAVPDGSAGDFTQALMELGALVCVPNGAAKCGECPCQYDCYAAKNTCTDRLPVRSGLPPRRIEARTLLLMEWEGKYLLLRRPDRGLLAGLWEFPALPGVTDASGARNAAAGFGFAATDVRRLPDATHIFTHIEWHMQAYLLHGAPSTAIPPVPGAVFATPEQMQKTYALPSAFAAYRKLICM